MTSEAPMIRAVGDRALRVQFGRRIDPAVSHRVRSLFHGLSQSQIAGIVDLLPGYLNLVVVYDPLQISFSGLKTRIRKVLAELDHFDIPAPNTIRVPVVYGGDFGPDLAFVADHNGISPEQVIETHAGVPYEVYMIGFTPGFPYMGQIDARIAAPRRRSPRIRVPRGSVGIAQRQTGIYPVESPGGWQIIGRTPVVLFDPERQPPGLLEIGDRVIFEPMEAEEYVHWSP